MTDATDRLPAEIYTAAQVRELDRIAIETHGIAGYELMCRAGQAGIDAIGRHWPSADALLVFCGAGNNAGDGYVVARLARALGYGVEIVALVPPDRLRGDAAHAWRDCRKAGLAPTPWAQFADEGPRRRGAPVVVDAVLGTGVERPLDGDFAAAVDWINASGRPVLALDVPSGLGADSGEPLGTAVRADVTVTFVGLKQGLYVGRAPDYRGALEFAGLEIPAAAYALAVPALRRLTHDDLAAALPPRPRGAHKGDHGRLLVIGGAPGMSGAARMAAEAALRAGAGLVDVATHADSVAAVMAGRPEIMCRAVDGPDALDDLLEAADAVVLGPGLGRSDWAEALWCRAVAADKPLLLDADGLNLLAAHAAERGDWVLTPHPGEAGRLLGTSAGDVQHDRLGACRRLVERYGAHVVLKGAMSLVGAPDGVTRVCDRGNPGMASGGMGDVLSGIVGALLAQTGDVGRSAGAGVLLHALAGDAAAAAGGERGLIASDLMPQIRRWANPQSF